MTPGGSIRHVREPFGAGIVIPASAPFAGIDHGHVGLRKQPMVYYGARLADAVATEAATAGLRRILPVVTPSLRNHRAVRDVLDGVEFILAPAFSEIRPHTPIDTVVSLIAAIRRSSPDALLAIGGGSAIDAAKIASLAIAAGADDIGDLLALKSAADADGELAPAAIDPSLPIIAVPTTLSAAEHGVIAGATHAGTKHLFKSFELPPGTIVYDPWLAATTPPMLWLSTGIRALDHAIETFLSLDANPFTDALAVRGMALLRSGLRMAHDRPDDACARHDGQMGSWLSGCSIGRVRYGASHGIAHQLGAVAGVPHGLTSCVLLPAVLDYNAPVSTAKQAVIADACGHAGGSASQAVRDLIRSLSLPTSMSELGVTRDALSRVAESALSNAFVRANPRPIRSPEDVMAILDAAF